MQSVITYDNSQTFNFLGERIQTIRINRQYEERSLDWKYGCSIRKPFFLEVRICLHELHLEIMFYWGYSKIYDVFWYGRWLASIIRCLLVETFVDDHRNLSIIEILVSAYLDMLGRIWNLLHKICTLGLEDAHLLFLTDILTNLNIGARIFLKFLQLLLINRQ